MYAFEIQLAGEFGVLMFYIKHLYVHVHERLGVRRRADITAESVSFDMKLPIKED